MSAGCSVYIRATSSTSGQGRVSATSRSARAEPGALPRRLQPRQVTTRRRAKAVVAGAVRGVIALQGHAGCAPGLAALL